MTDSAQTHKPAGRRMTLMGQATLMSQTDTNPSYPLGFMVMERNLDYDDFCKALVDRVLTKPAFERLRCRVVDFEVYAPIAIDIADHVRELDFEKDLFTMDNSTSTDIKECERKLAAFLNELSMEPFDMTKPLWTIYLLKNYSQGRSVLVFKTHHCIADGASLSIMLSTMTDPTPELKKLQAMTYLKKPVNHNRGISGALERFWGTLLLALYYLWGFITVNLKYAISFASPELKTQLKNPLVGERSHAWTKTTTVADVKLVGKAFEGTVNDVMTTAISGALRRYLLDGDQWTADQLRPLHLASPVNVRTPDDYDADYILRNMFGFVITTSPIDEADPIERLKIIRKNMLAIKRSPEQTLAYRSALLLARASASFQQRVMRFTNQYISYVCTNVAGPNIPMLMTGVPVVYGLGVVPPPPTVGLGFAIWSYYGMLRTAATVDIGTGVDGWKLCKYLDEELDFMISLAKDKLAADALAGPKATNAGEKKTQ